MSQDRSYLIARIACFQQMEPCAARDAFLKLAQADLDFLNAHPRSDYPLQDRRKLNAESELE